MPRRNRRQSQDARPVPGGMAQQWTETTSRGVWVVRAIRAGEKDYVCPGCNQTIPAGVAHVVAWQEDSLVAAEGRRHWHRPCWDRGAHKR